MTGQTQAFSTGLVLPTLAIAFILASMHSLLTAEPLQYGFMLFRWLSQPQMEPARVGLVIAGVPVLALHALHLFRRLLGQTMLEIGEEQIVFRGFVRREIPISEIKHIEVRYGEALIRLKRGRSVSIPVLLAADFFGIKRALERVNDRIQGGSSR